MLLWLIPLIMENPVAAAAIGFPTLALLSKIAGHYRRKRRVSQSEVQLFWLLLGALLLVMIPWSVVGTSRPLPPSVHPPDATEMAMVAFMAALFGIIGLAMVAAGISTHAYHALSRLCRWLNRKRKYEEKLGSTGFEPMDYLGGATVPHVLECDKRVAWESTPYVYLL